MAKIPSAKPSPRIELGIIKWYVGNTFSINIHLNLKDQDGEPITIAAADTVLFTFYNEAKSVVHTETFTNITGNNVTINVNNTVTAKFPKGKYEYTVLLTHSNKTTIANGNDIIVE